MWSQITGGSLYERWRKASDDEHHLWSQGVSFQFHDFVIFVILGKLISVPWLSLLSREKKYS